MRKLTGLLRETPLASPPRWLAIAVPAAVCALLLAYPLLDPTTYALSRLELLLLLIMAGIGLNLVHGYGGVLILAQPAMITLAGYTTGVLSLREGWAIEVTIPLAIIASVVLGIFLALPSFRVRGWYLAVLSIMAVVLTEDVIDGFRSVTGGSDGLPVIPPFQFGDYLPPRWLIYEAAVVLAILVWIAGRNLVKSGWGTSLMALRDFPYMAVSTGASKVRIRGVLVALMGIPCGVAGAFYAHSQQFIAATNFDINALLLLIGGVLLGGRGTLWGPVIGVAVFGGISYWIGPFSLWNPFIMGVGVMLSAIFFRLGIVGTVKQYWATNIAPREVAKRLFSEETEPGAVISPVKERPRLEISDLNKHFGGTYALQEVGLEMTGGEVVAVVGANGSGKTTKLNCVSGFVTPESGRMVLNGKDIRDMPPHRRAHLGMARTFQVPNIIEELTVLDNVAMGVYGLRPPSAVRAIFRTPRYRRREAEARERAVAACRALGLTDRAIYGSAGELTLALRRMVEIARALAGDASLICLDEPVAGLKQDAQDRVAAVLRDLAASGRAVMLIEHNLPFVLTVADRVVLLKDGRVDDVGVPLDVADRERPLGAYFHTFVPTADREKVQEAVASHQ